MPENFEPPRQPHGRVHRLRGARGNADRSPQKNQWRRPAARDPEAAEPGEAIFLLQHSRRRQALGPAAVVMIMTPDVEKAEAVVASLEAKQARLRDRPARRHDGRRNVRGI